MHPIRRTGQAISDALVRALVGKEGIAVRVEGQPGVVAEGIHGQSGADPGLPAVERLLDVVERGEVRQVVARRQQVLRVSGVHSDRSLALGASLVDDPAVLAVLLGGLRHAGRALHPARVWIGGVAVGGKPCFLACRAENGRRKRRQGKQQQRADSHWDPPPLSSFGKYGDHTPLPGSRRLFTPFARDGLLPGRRRVPSGAAARSGSPRGGPHRGGAERCAARRVRACATAPARPAGEPRAQCP